MAIKQIKKKCSKPGMGFDIEVGLSAWRCLARFRTYFGKRPCL